MIITWETINSEFLFAAFPNISFAEPLAIFHNLSGLFVKQKTRKTWSRCVFLSKRSNQLRILFAEFLYIFFLKQQYFKASISYNAIYCTSLIAVFNVPLQRDNFFEHLAYML